MFSTVVTAVPNYLIMAKLHLIDTHWSIILPAFSSSLGLYLMKQFIEANIPDSLIEAAHIDGAGENTVFFKIIMPLVKPAWLTLMIFAFQGLWGAQSTATIRSEELKTLSYALSQVVAGVGNNDDRSYNSICSDTEQYSRNGRDIGHEGLG